MIELSRQTVRDEWIDYNGHMNVAWYTQAFDHALDEMLAEHVGMDAQWIEQNHAGPFAVQAQFTYLSELRAGEEFFVRMRILDHAPRKLHLYAELVACADGRLCCAWESLDIHVDHETRRACPFPGDIYRRIQEVYEADRDAPWPELAGRPIAMTGGARDSGATGS